MDDRLLEIFRDQVGLQCKFMLRGANDVNLSLQNNDTGGVFYGLQNILSAGANVSKALWGQGGKLAQERKALRDSLQVSEESALKPTDMRNNFDHFDDRLKKWWGSSKHKNYADMNLGPRDAIQGIDPNDFFRNYDPQSKKLFFGGEEIDIQALIHEAQAILSRLKDDPNKLSL